MANKKKLQKATTKFRKENLAEHSLCSRLIFKMAQFIERSGAAEVTVGLKYGKYYEYANN